MWRRTLERHAHSEPIRTISSACLAWAAAELKTPTAQIAKPPKGMSGGSTAFIF